MRLLYRVTVALIVFMIGAHIFGDAFVFAEISRWRIA